MATLPAQKQSNSNKKDTHLKTSPSNTTEGSSKEIVIEQVIVNVFFDGTKNNLYNTDTYKNSPNKSVYDSNLDDYESYTNAYSNIAHLYQGRNIKSDDIWIYIDGIGTRRLGVDDQDGFAFGNGETGISTRANLAFKEIVKGVRKKHGENSKPSIIIINVFGFSRGAATARHFVHLAKTMPGLFPWNLSKNNIKIKFVGIFDTVSSYEPARTSQTLSGKAGVIFKGSNFNNDVEELHLNFSEGYADKVFHICALDEYRIFFSLTDIESARRLGCGYEVYLPGAHADIGGSYQDGKPNSYPVSRDVVLKKWFYQQSIFLEKDLVIKNYPQISKNYIPPSEKLIRSSVSNAYYKVPLKTMRLMAEKYANLSFMTKYFEDKNQNAGQVGQLLVQIPKTVLNGVRWGGAPADYSHLYQNLRGFRHKYVHWSAQYKLGYHLRRGKTTWADSTSVAKSEAFLDRDLEPYRKVWHG